MLAGKQVDGWFKLAGQDGVAESGGSELSAARLRIAVARLSRRLRPTEAAGSLTATEVDVLVAAERRGPIRLSDLASFAGLNPTMLSRLIPKLEEAGLIRRLGVETDRRVCRVEATAKGRRLLERIRTERNDALSKRLGSSVLSSVRPCLWPFRSWRSWPSDLPGLSRGPRVGRNR